jgi:hypothetical protein|nr:MAG TPA: hypothetical protein [Caudoviricetes sp.]
MNGVIQTLCRWAILNDNYPRGDYNRAIYMVALFIGENMAQSVNGMNRSMRTLVDEAIARRQAAEELKQQYYREAADRQLEEANKRAEQASQLNAVSQGGGQTPAQAGAQPPMSPLDDPDSMLSKLIKERGLTKEQYLKLNIAERQYDFADPILEQKWNAYVAANPDVAALDDKQINARKDAFFQQGRNLYSANFKAEEAKESAILDRLGNVAGDVVEGVSQVITGAGGLLRPVLGNDNIVSKGLNTVGEAGIEFGKGLASDAERAREEYFYRLMETGRYTDAAKFAAQNPLMLGGEALQMVAGTKGFGALTKGSAALTGKGLSAVGASKAGQVVNKIGQAVGNSMPAYAGLSVGGEVGNELAKRGIDTTTPEGRIAVAMSFVGGAIANKITPHNIENQVAKWGLSKEAAKVVSRQAIEDLEKLGLMQAAGKRLLGITKNVVKGGVNEGAEEFMQSGLGAYAAQALIDKDGKFRNWEDVPQDVKDQVVRRAVSGGLLGTALGGTTSGAVNAIAGGVHGDVQTNVDYNTSRQKYAKEDAEAQEAQAQAEAEAKAQAEAEQQAQEAQAQAEEAQAQAQAEAEEQARALSEAERAAAKAADLDSEIQRLRAEYGTSSIDANEVASTKARTEYNNYLDEQYDNIINSEETSDEQRAILENAWGDGARTLRAKAAILRQMGVDVEPAEFVNVAKNGKVTFKNGLDKYMDFRHDELTKTAQAKYDEAEVTIERLRQQGLDEATADALSAKLENARQANNEGAIKSVLTEAKSTKVTKPDTKTAEQQTRELVESQYDDEMNRFIDNDVYKGLTRQERVQVQSRAAEDQAFLQKLHKAYAERLVATGKEKSKATSLRKALLEDLDTLLSTYRPNKLSAKERAIYGRLPEKDGLWWTEAERELVKTTIEQLYKDTNIAEPVDSKNLRASIPALKAMRTGLSAENQARVDTLLGALQVGTPFVVAKNAGEVALKALNDTNKLPTKEDFTGKSQAPSQGRLLRRTSAD